jgi:tRNA(Ile)-lysidine synthase
LRAEAEADAGFVSELAGRWGLPLHVERIDTPALARQWGAGVEEAARRGRYEALAAVAAGVSASAVAVAHHAADQVETVVHRIVRGTHLRGLSGMPPKRRLGPSVWLVRPLLWARRGEIEDFCRAEGLAWRIDHTNLQTDFTRNFIRHELLPLLRRRLNVKADEAVLRLAAAAGQAHVVLAELAGKLFARACRKRSADEVVLRIAPLRGAPPLLATMALRAALASLGAGEQALSRDRYDDLLELLAGASSAADLPGGVRAERRGQALWLSRQRPQAPGAVERPPPEG